MAKDESVKDTTTTTSWIRVTKDSVPIVPQGEDYIKVLAWHPEWESPKTIEYWDKEAAGADESDSLWNEPPTYGPPDPEPTYFHYLPELPSISMDLYDIHEHELMESFPPITFCKTYSLFNVTTASHEMPKGIYSFKASSQQEALTIARKWLEDHLYKI